MGSALGYFSAPDDNQIGFGTVNKSFVEGIATAQEKAFAVPDLVEKYKEQIEKRKSNWLIVFSPVFPKELSQSQAREANLRALKVIADMFRGQARLYHIEHRYSKGEKEVKLANSYLGEIRYDYQPYVIDEYIITKMPDETPFVEFFADHYQINCYTYFGLQFNNAPDKLKDKERTLCANRTSGSILLMVRIGI